MVDAARRLERGGADFIVIDSDTMNSMVELIEANVGIPVLHIVDATGEKIRQEDVSVPVFDTMTIHAQAAVKYALNEKERL